MKLVSLASFTLSSVAAAPIETRPTHEQSGEDPIADSESAPRRTNRETYQPQAVVSLDQIILPLTDDASYTVVMFRLGEM